MSEFISHITKDWREQTNYEHLMGTAELSGKFASYFNAESEGKLAGTAHDIGKYSEGFRERIRNNGKKVDHSTAGAVECLNVHQFYAAYAVIGHHSGLPDRGVMDDNSSTSTFWSRINRAKSGGICDYSAWKTEITLPPASPPDWVMKNPFSDMFYIKMLYSCLVDADFLDTAEFMLNEPYMDADYSNMAELNSKFESYISNWFPPTNELNEKRCEILKACMNGANNKSELFTLTVPTGGGKTVASLAFAIKRAIRQDSPRRRIIYVIPYTSIIEQTAETFRNIFGAENVLEHHSGVVFDESDEASSENINKLRATENWDAPIIVTTAVQFFESLYANRSSKCRKVHNIADSVIIFDEVQMLPLSYLKPCVYAIAELVSHFNVTAVLCTATQPSLDNYFNSFKNDYIKDNNSDFSFTELCLSELFNDDIFRRVTYRNVGKMSTESLADELNGLEQVLCVVNSRAFAHELYDKMNDDGGRFHLSTLMTSCDRKKILDVIRERLKNGLPCRVISTSLIEAGVDVDFPLVYREKTGIDSIIQAAGRCNREGKRSFSESVVTIFESENKTPLLFRQNIDATNAVMRKYEDISSVEAIEKYFKYYRGLMKKDSVDKHGILDKIKTLSIKTIAEQFHIIENDTVTVYIPTSENEELIQRCRDGEMSRGLMRSLGQYGVSIYDRHFNELYGCGDIEKIADGLYVLANSNLYDSRVGLSIEADVGKAEFI